MYQLSYSICVIAGGTSVAVVQQQPCKLAVLGGMLAPAAQIIAMQT